MAVLDFMRTIILILTIIVPLKSIAAELHNYLLYSEPLILKFSDGSKDTVLVSGAPKGMKDTLLLVINDEVRDQAIVTMARRGGPMKYEEYVVSCGSWHTVEDRGVNFEHKCWVEFAGEPVGILELKRYSAQ